VPEENEVRASWTAPLWFGDDEGRARIQANEGTTVTNDEGVVRSHRDVPGWTGRYFEDFVVGDRYRHPLGRTITETDNIWMTLLTQNTSPLHFDHHYAAQTSFGRPLVDSTFTLALVTGQSVIDVSQHVFANLGWDEVRLPAPVFAGDTIYSESEVLSSRLSSSRPETGVVTVETIGFNQEGTIVITFRRTMLIYRRGFGPDTSSVQPKRR
jgi:itaconyl-CoA hydratase